MRIVYNDWRRPDPELCMEKPDPTSMLETTGYERIEKTVNRLMRSGLNLYLRNRNIDPSDLEDVENGPVSISKFSDVKDVNMYMREIQNRLKRKVRSPVVDKNDVKESEVIEATKVEKNNVKESEVIEATKEE